MPKYHASFIGRRVGAIGITYQCSMFVDAATPADAAHKPYDTHEHIHGLRVVELPIRYVATFINREGLRTLMDSAQGRYTYDTAERAQAWIDAMRRENPPERIASIWGSDPRFEVRPVHCWPGHFDPIGVYFDTDESYEVAQ